MFKKLLVPLDGSTTAEQALAWAKLYAAPSKAQVVVLQVLHPEYPLEGLPFRAGAAEARSYLQGPGGSTARSRKPAAPTATAGTSSTLRHRPGPCGSCW